MDQFAGRKYQNWGEILLTRYVSINIIIYCYFIIFICLKEMLKLNPNTDDVYGPLQRLDDAFSHDSHVGAVTSIDWSPFHRFGFSQKSNMPM